MPAIKWIVTVGAVFALCTSLLGAMFPLPRVLYAMGSDGVLFKPLAKIHTRTKTPILATILSGLLSGKFKLYKKLHYFRLTCFRKECKNISKLKPVGGFFTFKEIVQYFPTTCLPSPLDRFRKRKRRGICM